MVSRLRNRRTPAIGWRLPGPLCWRRAFLGPKRIRFSQSWCSPTFRSGLPIAEWVIRLLLGASVVTDLPLIHVVWTGKHWFSLDNRRLAAYRFVAIVLRQVGIHFQIPVLLFRGRPSLALRLLQGSGKYCTRCRGRWITIRRLRVRIGRSLSECRY